MIAFKNLYPEEFVKLHRREGNVYKYLTSKDIYINLAIRSLNDKIAELQKEEDALSQTLHLQEHELQVVYAQQFKEQFGHYDYIYIDDKCYPLKDVTSDASLFNRLFTSNNVKGGRTYYSYDLDTINIKNIENTINKEHSYLERLKALSAPNNYLAQKRNEIEAEKNRIRSLTIHELCDTYHLWKAKEYKERIHLEAAEDVFIRNGYIGEDYYDYISYFYDDIISQADHEFLLSTKTDKPLGFDWPLDNPENVVKTMKPHLFKSLSILNLGLLDYLMSTGSKYTGYINSIIDVVTTNASGPGFISQYYISGKYKDTFFSKLYTDHRSWFWDCAREFYDSNNGSNLQEAFFSSCSTEELETEQTEWLESHFSFVAQWNIKCDKERLDRILKRCKFKKITSESPELLQSVIKYCSYIITTENLTIIINFINGYKTIDSDNLNFTRIISAGNKTVTDYISENLDISLETFSQAAKNESAESNLQILNDETVAIDKKRQYLSGQQNKIGNINDIIPAEMVLLAIDLNLIKGSWDNAVSYYNNNGFDNHMVKYINNTTSEIADTTLDITENEDMVRELIRNATSIGKFNILANNFSEFDFENESWIEDIDINEILKLLNASGFTKKQKITILNKCSADKIRESYDLADTACDLYLDTTCGSIDTDKASAILDTINNIRRKVLLATKTILQNGDSQTIIDNIIAALPEEYHELSEKGPRPRFENNEHNYTLIKALADIRYISSFSISSGKIRAITKHS